MSLPQTKAGKPRPYSKLDFLIDPVKPFPFKVFPFPQTIIKTKSFKLEAV